MNFIKTYVETRLRVESEKNTKKNTKNEYWKAEHITRAWARQPNGRTQAAMQTWIADMPGTLILEKETAQRMETDDRHKFIAVNDIFQLENWATDI